MSDLPARAAEEVVALHAAFVDLFTGRGEVTLESVMARFHPAFVRVGPGGAAEDRAGLEKMLAATAGMVPDGFEIRIAIEAAIEAGPGAAVVRYTERQEGRDESRRGTMRRATATFLDGEHGPLWLALQETWIQPAKPGKTPADEPCDNGGLDA